jgi:hypothetical protein
VWRPRLFPRGRLQTGTSSESSEGAPDVAIALPLRLKSLVVEAPLPIAGAGRAADLELDDRIHAVAFGAFGVVCAAATANGSASCTSTRSQANGSRTRLTIVRAAVPMFFQRSSRAHSSKRLLKCPASSEQ